MIGNAQHKPASHAGKIEEVIHACAAMSLIAGMEVKVDVAVRQPGCIKIVSMAHRWQIFPVIVQGSPCLIRGPNEAIKTRYSDEHMADER